MIFCNYKSSSFTNRVQQMLREPWQWLSLCKSSSLTPFPPWVCLGFFVQMNYCRRQFFVIERIKVALDRTGKVYLHKFCTGIGGFLLEQVCPWSLQYEFPWVLHSGKTNIPEIYLKMSLTLCGLKPPIMYCAEMALKKVVLSLRLNRRKFQ